jgi:hypothetical protein
MSRHSSGPVDRSISPPPEWHELLEACNLDGEFKVNVNIHQHERLRFCSVMIKKRMHVSPKQGRFLRYVALE